MRLDNQGHILVRGERQRKNGSFEYRFMSDGKRRSLYFPTLRELRHTVYGIVMEDSYVELEQTMRRLKEKYGSAWVW